MHSPRWRPPPRWPLEALPAVRPLAPARAPHDGRSDGSLALDQRPLAPQAASTIAPVAPESSPSQPPDACTLAWHRGARRGIERIAPRRVVLRASPQDGKPERERPRETASPQGARPSRGPPDLQRKEAVNAPVRPARAAGSSAPPDRAPARRAGDADLTDRLRIAAELVGVVTRDDVVVAAGDYYSFVEAARWRRCRTRKRTTWSSVPLSSGWGGLSPRSHAAAGRTSRGAHFIAPGGLANCRSVAHNAMQQGRRQSNRDSRGGAIGRQRVGRAGGGARTGPHQQQTSGVAPNQGVVDGAPRGHVPTR